jgi:hypothetical protein
MVKSRAKPKPIRVGKFDEWEVEAIRAKQTRNRRTVY